MAKKKTEYTEADLEQNRAIDKATEKADKASDLADQVATLKNRLDGLEQKLNQLEPLFTLVDKVHLINRHFGVTQ